MIFTPTSIAGAYIIDIEKKEDERGFFARTWCKKEFYEQGLEIDIVQCNISHNIKKGTLRGMHYQVKPYEEIKVVTCIAGAIFDVILDLREESSTCGQWYSVELTAMNHRSLYIPAGVAHGFKTLEDNSSIFYQMSEFYHEKYACGVRWNDERYNIQWPLSDILFISQKDVSW